MSELSDFMDRKAQERASGPAAVTAPAAPAAATTAPPLPPAGGLAAYLDERQRTPAASNPSWWQRNITGEGQYDPDIPNTPPPLPKGASAWDYAAVGGGRLATSDPDALANIYVQHFPGAKAGKDKYGATIVTLANGYKFHPNPPGVLDMPSVMSGLGTVATDTAALMTGGASGALGVGLRAGQLGAAQLARGEGGIAAGSGESHAKVGSEAALAAATSPLAELGTSLASKAVRAVTAPYRAAASADLVGSLLKKQNFDWDNLPGPTKAAMLERLQGHSAAEVTAALADPKNAAAFWNTSAGKDFGVNISLGQATGDKAILDREAALAVSRPGSALARQSTTVPEKVGGLLDRQMADPAVAGKAVEDALKGQPEQAWVAARRAEQDLVLKHGTTPLPADSLLPPVEKRLANEVIDPTNTPRTFGAQWNLHALVNESEGDIPAAAILQARQDVIEQMAKARGSDLTNLGRIKDGLDEHLANSPFGSDFRAALKAQSEAAKFQPGAPLPDRANRLLHDLTYEPRSTDYEAVYRNLTGGSPAENAQTAHLLVQKLGADHPAVQQLGGAYLKEKLTGAGGSVADLGAPELAKRLAKVTNDPVAMSLFPPGQLAEMRRAQGVLENMSQRGTAQDSAWSVIRGLVSAVPGMAAATGMVMHGNLWGAAGALAGRRQINAGARPFLNLVPDLMDVRAANAAMNPAAIPFRPLAMGPAVRGAAAMGGAAAGAALPPALVGGPGLLNPPLAVQSRGLMD